MGSATVLIFHPGYEGRGFSRLRRAWERYGCFLDLVRRVGLVPEHVGLRSQPEATDDEILTVHDPAYLAYVKQKDEEGVGFVDYGDTPAYHGVLRRARIAVGGTVLAARLAATGVVAHAFNPGGGLHHAHPDRAGGFCVFNDVAIAVRLLQREHGFRRIAILDVDGHHGDGTQAIFERESLLTVSFHRYGERFYPRTGSADETGVGAGRGYNVNVPLPRGTGGATYLAAFDAIVPPLLDRYRPDFLLVQFGVDGHYQDPLVRLRLTTHSYQALARRVHDFAHHYCSGRLVMVGGGGYNPEAVARCWTVGLATVAGADLPNVTALHDPADPPEDDGVAEAVAATVARVQTLAQAAFGEMPSSEPQPPAPDP